MSFLFILTVLTLFGFIHSWLAGRSVKNWFRARLGVRRYEASYRLAYNVLSVVLLAPVGVALVAAPGATIWQVDNGLAVLALNALRLAGVVGLAASLLQIDWMRFAGLAQVVAYVEGRPLPLPDEPLQTGGVYAVVRHPLYFFSLLVLWPASTMTEALLAFNIGSTVYFLAGSLLEERRLGQTFGAAYTAYRQQTPWMLPRLRSHMQFSGRTVEKDTEIR